MHFKLRNNLTTSFKKNYEFGLCTNFLTLEADRNDTTSKNNYILECSVLLDS